MDNDLAALAAAYGVATEFWDQSGQHQVVPAETVVAVLAALGVDATTHAGIQAALHERRMRDWRRALPPVYVQRQGDAAQVWVHLPHGDSARLWIELEDGGARHDVGQVDRWVEPVEVDGGLVGEATFALPGDLPTGWHRLHAELRSHEGDARFTSTVLVVTPRRLELPEALRTRRGWGFGAQLYSVRSSRSWGLGDLGDLSDLVAWSGHDLGADFLLINPLHAASPVPPMAPSPYLPVTRRFANPVYIRVEAVPEFAYLGEAGRKAVEMLSADVKATNATADLLERDPVWKAKRSALEFVHAVPLSPGRRARYAAFREREGSGLEDFALWCALADTYGQPADWPEELADPKGEAAEKARTELADLVEFHVWLQWVLDEQLEAAQEAATDAGMAIGVMHDLAVGVHPEGADAWALRDVLAKDVAVGAPPDMYNQMGQDWSQPPWRPDALAEAAFIPYRDMLRTVLKHAGGIRIDHVLGLFRLWWIPRGMPAKDGTYVRYDHDALVGILALEAQRAGRCRHRRGPRHRRGVGAGQAARPRYPRHLDPVVRGRRGRCAARARALRRAALTSVTTHDLPPTWASSRASTCACATARPARQALRGGVRRGRAVADAWRRLLQDRGLLRPDAGSEEFVEALHRLIAQSPARLLCVSLADAVGDRRAQNQPGTDRGVPELARAAHRRGYPAGARGGPAGGRAAAAHRRHRHVVTGPTRPAAAARRP
ncbi:MAG: 4-alpha-glucanotransferase [Candidatus Nanopelagicales bacterium]